MLLDRRHGFCMSVMVRALVGCVGRGVCVHGEAQAAATTALQCWPGDCRNKVADGYQGVVSGLRDQRHSIVEGRMTRSGWPIAPAQWAARVSTLISISVAAMAAA